MDLRRRSAVSDRVFYSILIRVGERLLVTRACQHMKDTAIGYGFVRGALISCLEGNVGLTSGGKHWNKQTLTMITTAIDKEYMVWRFKLA